MEWAAWVNIFYVIISDYATLALGTKTDSWAQTGECKTGIQTLDGAKNTVEEVKHREKI